MKGSEYPQRALLLGAGEVYAGKQGPDYTPGVSAESAGSRGIWMGTIALSPGGRTRAHLHDAHETAIFMIKGEVRVYHGRDLAEEPLTMKTGEFLFIPAGVPHVAINESKDEAEVVLARTDPNEQESVVLLPELENRVPA